MKHRLSSSSSFQHVVGPHLQRRRAQAGAPPCAPAPAHAGPARTQEEELARIRAAAEKRQRKAAKVGGQGVRP